MIDNLCNTETWSTCENTTYIYTKQKNTQTNLNQRTYKFKKVTGRTAPGGAWAPAAHEEGDDPLEERGPGGVRGGGVRGPADGGAHENSTMSHHPGPSSRLHPANMSLEHVVYEVLDHRQQSHALTRGASLSVSPQLPHWTRGGHMTRMNLIARTEDDARVAWSDVRGEDKRCVAARRRYYARTTVRAFHPNQSDPAQTDALLSIF